MTTCRELIDQWPSRAAFADDIGVTPQSATNMIARNSIPARYWAAMVASAEKRAIDNVSLEVLASIAAQTTGEAAA